jgi:two-component system LytT family response regulator
VKAISLALSEDPNFQQITAEQTAASMGVVPIPQACAGPQFSRIAIKVKGQILFVYPSDVVAIEAQGNYVLLQRDTNSYLLRDSISVVAAKLEPYGFIRIHRSVLVNASFVDIIRPYSTGEYGLRLKGGKEYTVTRTYKNNLKYLAKFWIGTGAFFPD